MSEDKPRYSRVSDIIELATFMASRIQGVTLQDIVERYNVSRRTAERMRDSLLNIFPQIEEIETPDIQKHWGFVDYSIKELISFSPKEIANLHQLQKRTTNSELKKELGNTIDKIKCLQNCKNKNSIETNVEMYLQTEGYAVRQMPQYKIDNDILIKTREALKESKELTCIYHDKIRSLKPLGMIYGEKIYLLAYENEKGTDIYTYLLHKLSNVELTEKTFDRGNFDLKEYSKRSFGVYFGEPLKVTLLFDKEISTDVLNYNFHPTQKMKIESDGAVKVQFTASGDKEIMWHIFKWGDSVRILAPKRLKDEYKEVLNNVLKKY